MAYGRGMQIERKTDQEFAVFNKPWGVVKHSHKFDKMAKNRRERRRVKLNPECPPEYNRYYYYEW